MRELLIREETRTLLAWDHTATLQEQIEKLVNDNRQQRDRRWIDIHPLRQPPETPIDPDAPQPPRGFDALKELARI